MAIHPNIREEARAIHHACQVITSKLAWMEGHHEYGPDYEGICRHVKQIKTNTNWISIVEAIIRGKMAEKRQEGV